MQWNGQNGTWSNVWIFTRIAILTLCLSAIVPLSFQCKNNVGNNFFVYASAEKVTDMLSDSMFGMVYIFISHIYKHIHFYKCKYAKQKTRIHWRIEAKFRLAFCFVNVIGKCWGICVCVYVWIWNMHILCSFKLHVEIENGERGIQTMHVEKLKLLIFFCWRSSIYTIRKRNGIV